MVNAISNNNLRLSDIPPAESDWATIQRFALTFDGYGENGSFDACAAIASERRHASLNDLRTCLFFAQRSYRHCGLKPDGEEMAYIQRLVERIRSYVQAGSST